MPAKEGVSLESDHRAVLSVYGKGSRTVLRRRERATVERGSRLWTAAEPGATSRDDGQTNFSPGRQAVSSTRSAPMHKKGSRAVVGPSSEGASDLHADLQAHHLTHHHSPKALLESPLTPTTESEPPTPSAGPIRPRLCDSHALLLLEEPEPARSVPRLSVRYKRSTSNSLII